MNVLKIAMCAVALIWASNAGASVYHTNESESEQTLTIVQQINYSYYGFDNWSTTQTFTVVVAPGETVYYEDYITTWGDGADYREVYDLVAVD